MLDNKTIKKILENKEIEIKVAFERKYDDYVQHKSEKDILSSHSKNNLYSDRLKLTIGPLIKVLNKKSIKKKYRYKNFHDCYDLRKSNNKYELEPGESIVVLTNERIKLNGKYACLISPRISMSDVGIVVTTAYVDPYYNGIMRLHITNLSDKRYELTFLETIAQCFFFELSDSVSEKFKDEFPFKSVFYGNTWTGILNSDRNPFPTKKESSTDDRFSNLKYQLSVIWAFIKKHSLIFLLLTNFITIICGVTTFKHNFTKYTTSVEQIKSFLEPVSTEIVINSGETYGEKEIVVNYPKAEIISVLCNNDNINYKIISGDTEDVSKIIFSANLNTKQASDYELNFTYTIIRRLQ